MAQDEVDGRSHQVHTKLPVQSLVFFEYHFPQRSAIDQAFRDEDGIGIDFNWFIIALTILILGTTSNILDKLCLNCDFYI